MNEQPTICELSEKCRCSGAKDIICSGNQLVVKVNGGNSYVIFAHKVNTFVLCQAPGFQVFVWGSTKYTIWGPYSRDLRCVILEDVFIDVCTSNVFAISKTPMSCSKVRFTPCKYELAELLAKSKIPLFVLVNIEAPQRLVNVVSEGDENTCLDSLNLVRNLREGEPKW